MPQIAVPQQPEQLAVGRILHDVAAQARLAPGALEIRPVAPRAIVLIEAPTRRNVSLAPAIWVYPLPLGRRNPLQPILIDLGAAHHGRQTQHRRCYPNTPHGYLTCP